MSFLAQWIYFATLGVLVSSRIIEQWPVLPNRKADSDYVVNVEASNAPNKDWNQYFGRTHRAFKPVEEVNAIVVTKNVPLDNPPTNYLTYPLTLTKEVPVPNAIEKFIPVSVSQPSLSYAIGLRDTALQYQVPYSYQFINFPVPHPIGNKIPVYSLVPNKIPVPVSHLAHDDPNGLEHSAHQPEVSLVPLHLNVPVEHPVQEVNQKTPGTIIVEKNTPYFGIYLVPFPVQSLPKNTRGTGSNEKEKVEGHFKTGFYSNEKTEEVRSRLDASTHDHYNVENLSEGQRSDDQVKLYQAEDSENLWENAPHFTAKKNDRKIRSQRFDDVSEEKSNVA